MVKIGDHVVFVDNLSRRQDALVTAVWPQYNPGGEPGLNVVMVSGDEAKGDTYGRQLERHTSQVHVSKQAAPGMYWCYPTEYSAERDLELRRQQPKQ